MRALQFATVSKGDHVYKSLRLLGEGWDNDFVPELRVCNKDDYKVGYHWLGPRRCPAGLIHGVAAGVVPRP